MPRTSHELERLGHKLLGIFFGHCECFGESVRRELAFPGRDDGGIGLRSGSR